MSFLRLPLSVALAVSFIACASVERPESKILGVWQEEFPPTARPGQWILPLTGIQLEFLSNGNVTLNERRGQGNWGQAHVGTYTILDGSHLKLDFGSTSFMDEAPRTYIDETPRTYEFSFVNPTRLDLRTADGTFRLMRIH
ncbi:MAG TPA: hypothetical protein VMB02_05795 [Candidatus Aquilonibacter sp.]|nr:hypothetical protein [Candidatus Aquilonibacter sp.]